MWDDPTSCTAISWVTLRSREVTKDVISTMTAILVSTVKIENVIGIGLGALVGPKLASPGAHLGPQKIQNYLGLALGANMESKRRKRGVASRLIASRCKSHPDSDSFGVQCEPTLANPGACFGTQECSIGWEFALGANKPGKGHRCRCRFLPDSLQMQIPP